MSYIQEVKSICIEKLLVPFEGYHKKLPNGDCAAYPDPATGGKPFTIGYGSTYDENGVPVQPGDIWTHEKALMVKAVTLDKFIKEVTLLSPNLIKEKPERFAAILSFCYNCGSANYRISTLRKRVNEGNWLEASKEILKWNKGNGKVMKGLTLRRIAESKLLI